MASLTKPPMSYHLAGGTGAVQTGGTGPLDATRISVLITVPDSTAVRTSVAVPTAAPAGTLMSTVAAPPETPMLPSSVDTPAASTKTAFSEVFTGLPSEVRSSLA